MRHFTALLASVSLVAGAVATALPAAAQGTWEDRRLERLASPELQTFASERDYRRWVRDLRRAQRNIYFDRRRGLADAGGDVIVVAQADLAVEECNPQYEDCGEDMSIVVTGSRIASMPQSTPIAITAVGAEASITNNQVAAVDEGDIVKRIGDYLLVLQDGRIHAANFRTMQLTDRIDAYRRDADGDPIGADWYDEMLVQGDHILVTAYSYADEATELSVFRLDRATGRIERRGVFLISSDDYYDSDNYATRVVGDQLVMYTEYKPEDLVDVRRRPVIRRWSAADEFDEREKGGRPILSAEDIRLPVFGVENPSVHMISVCALDNLDGDDLPCETTGFISGEGAEMFVAADNVYLATSAADWRDRNVWSMCRGQEPGTPVSSEPPPGAVFRLPLGRGDADLLPVRGMVIDQFSMDQHQGRFRMVGKWSQYRCGERRWDPEIADAGLELTDQRIGSFSASYRPAPARRFTPLPHPGNGIVENRFIGEWLLYGARSRYGRPPVREEDDVLEPAAAFAVPLATPTVPVSLPLGHEITRLESLGRDAIATGYRDDSGLNISYIDLGETARIADRAFLADRFESESRSHAFNATLKPGGEGYMGLPTVIRAVDAGRRPWRSDNSQLSFLSFDPAGRLADIGMIAPAKRGSEDDDGESVDCEVSCTDWYGNARPIFIGDMAYALMGTELVEARPSPTRIEVMRRLSLATLRGE